MNYQTNVPAQGQHRARKTPAALRTDRPLKLGSWTRPGAALGLLLWALCGLSLCIPVGAEPTLRLLEVSPPLPADQKPVDGPYMRAVFTASNSEPSFCYMSGGTETVHPDFTVEKNTLSATPIVWSLLPCDDDEYWTYPHSCELKQGENTANSGIYISWSTGFGTCADYYISNRLDYVCSSNLFDYYYITVGSGGAVVGTGMTYTDHYDNVFGCNGAVGAFQTDSDFDFETDEKIQFDSQQALWRFAGRYASHGYAAKFYSPAYAPSSLPISWATQRNLGGGFATRTEITSYDYAVIGMAEGDWPHYARVVLVNMRDPEGSTHAGIMGPILLRNDLSNPDAELLLRNSNDIMDYAIARRNSATEPDQLLTMHKFLNPAGRFDAGYYVARWALDLSNPSACLYSLSSSATSFDAAGGSTAVGVTADSGCSWTATEGLDWLTITSGSSGSGPGVVAFSVAANTSSAQRSGVITIAGHSHTVTQLGQTSACSYSISSPGSMFDSSGGLWWVDVAATSGCAWTASESLDWITITSGSSGSGSGRVSYSVAANNSAFQRSGVITIAGQTYTVTQQGQTTPAQAALYVSNTLPSSMDPAQSQTATITVRNTGTATWTENDGYRIGMPSNSNGFGSTRFVLSSSVPPGADGVFSATLTAPSSAGTYNNSWRMLQENVAWFGPDPLVTQTITVAPALRSAEYVSDTFPASMTTSQIQTATITVRNTGTATWTEGDRYRVGLLGTGNDFSTTRFVLSSSVAPGATGVFSATLTAPAPGFEGTYDSLWRMLQEGQVWFGPDPLVRKSITVIAGVHPANDDWANAASLSGFSGTVTANNVGATFQPGEAPVGCGSASNGTVWWLWVPPALPPGYGTGAMAVIDTVGSDLDTILEIFQSDWTTVTPTCSDEYIGHESYLRIYAVAGSPYWIRVSGYGNEQGNITLNWKYFYGYDRAAVRMSGLPETMAPGSAANVTLTVVNLGITRWTPEQNYRLGAGWDSYDPFAPTRLDFPPGTTVAQGDSYDFNVVFHAPTVPGIYSTDWEMLKEGEHWFNEQEQFIVLNVFPSAYQQIRVGDPPPAPGFTAGAQVVSVTGIPSSMSPGETATATVVMRNTGATAWSNGANFRFGARTFDYTENNILSVNRVYLTRDVPVGDQYSFTFTVRAPLTPGTYETTWQMLRELVEWLGEPVTRSVTVCPGCGAGAESVGVLADAAPWDPFN